MRVSVRALLRNVVDGIGDGGDMSCLTQENLLNNFAKLRARWSELDYLPPHHAIFTAIAEHVDGYGEVPSFETLRAKFRHAEYTPSGERLPDGPTPDMDAYFEMDLLTARAVVAPLIRTNYAHLLNRAILELQQVRLRADLAKLSDEINATINKGGDGFALLGPAFERFRQTYLTTGTATCDADNPLASLKALGSVAVVGRDKILDLASKEIVYIWEGIATQGTSVLLSAGPGSGKTTLLFLLLAARLNQGGAVPVLGHRITPAPAGKFLVVIENEHSEESASRIVVRSCRLLGVDDHCLDRLVLVGRKNVLLNSPVWQDIEKLITSGLCSDVVIDTLARFAPGDANEEEAQVAVFAAVQAAIEKAPSPDTQPTCWIAAHSRKGGSGGIDDVSGSAQRAGQVDAVLTMQAQHVDGKVRSVKVMFPKIREKDADSWPDPVVYRIGNDGITVNGAALGPQDLPLPDRVLEILRDGAKTSNAIEKLVGRNHKDVQDAISELFARKAIVSDTVTVAGTERKGYALRPPDMTAEEFIGNE